MARAQPWLDPTRPVWQPCSPSQLFLPCLLVTERPSGPNLLELSANSSTDGTAPFSSSSPRQPTWTKLNAGEISFDPVDPAVRADRREAVSTREGRRSWQGLNPGSIRARPVWQPCSVLSGSLSTGSKLLKWSPNSANPATGVRSYLNCLTSILPMPNCLGIGSEIQLLTSPVECSFTEVRSRIQDVPST